MGENVFMLLLLLAVLIITQYTLFFGASSTIIMAVLDWSLNIYVSFYRYCNAPMLESWS